MLRTGSEIVLHRLIKMHWNDIIETKTLSANISRSSIDFIYFLQRVLNEKETELNLSSIFPVSVFIMNSMSNDS